MNNFKHSSKIGQSINLKSVIGLNMIPIAVALLTGLVIIILFRYLPKEMPLFYSMPWGKKQLANPQQFFVIPFLMILVTFINQIIAWQLHESQKFFKKILLITSFVASGILIITFIRIIWIFI